MNHDTQLRQEDHLSLRLLCHKSNNHSCVWQDTFDEVELLFSTISIVSIKIQHKKFINCTLQLSLSKRFRVDEKVNTIDDSNRDIFSILFLSRENILQIFCTTAFISHACTRIEMLLASLIDNIVMTRIIFRLLLCKIFVLPCIFLFSRSNYTRGRKSKRSPFWTSALTIDDIGSKQSKSLYEGMQSVVRKKWRVRYASRQKQEDDDHSIGISIHLPSSFSLFFTFVSFSVGASIYDILQLVTDANTPWKRNG